MNINSKEYWDNRFDTDWESYGGSSQTKFFAELACKMMPEWFVRDMRANQYKIYDMGCALGDAVDVLSSYFENEHVKGIDFSDEAITIAREKYPNHSYFVADFTQPLTEYSCDVIFCSNVLEHLKNPKKILEEFAKIASKYIVVLIPFKENVEIAEHITKFNEHNIPVHLGNFELIYSNSVDGSKIEHTYYSEQQILLIYSAKSTDKELLKLFDITQGSNNSFLRDYISKKEYQTAMEKSQAQISALINEKDELYHTHEEITQKWSKLQQEYQELTLNHTALQAENTHLHEIQEDLENNNLALIENTKELSKTISQLKLKDEANQSALHKLSLEKQQLDEKNTSLSKELQEIQKNMATQNDLDNALYIIEQKDLIIERALQKCDSMLRSKLFKVTHLLNRTLNQGIRGNKTERKLFRKWVLQHHKTGGDQDRRYNPLWPLIDILHSPIEQRTINQILQNSSEKEDPLSKHLLSEKARFENYLNSPLNTEAKKLKEYIKNRNYKGILIYPHTVYWEPLQTPQQLLRAFAKEGWLCLFCEHPNITDCFREVEPNLIITHEAEILSALEDEQVTVMITWAGSMAFTDKIKNKILWYHILDKLDIFPYYGSMYEYMHKQLLQTASYVSYVARPLTACIHNREDAIYLSNGSNPDEFLNKHEAYIPEDMKPIVAKNHTIIGYYGYIAEWMDYQMIHDMALQRPEYEFVFIGKVIADTSLIENLPNIHFLGLKKYTELSDYAKFFDVATIPFVINEMMHCVSPIKFYEYCALGLPVVTSSMKEVESFKCEFVACAENKDEFLFYLDHFSNTQTKKIAQEKAPFIALQNTWQARAAKMERLFQKEKISILSKDYTKYDVIILGVIDYDFRFQRPQHFASKYAENGHRVFYINANHFNPTNVTQIKENLFIVNINNKSYSAIHLTDWSSQLDELQDLLRNLVDTYCIRDAITIVDYPNWILAASYLKETYGFKIVTDYMDDYTGFLNPAEKLVGENCKKLLTCSDMVIPSSQFLYEIAQKFNSNISIVRNGTEFEHFHQAYTPAPKTQGKIIGYYGAIAEWFDINKICYLAEKMPECTIMLIGHISCGEKKLKSYTNIQLLGEKPYSELPEYLKAFDVCLIPFDTSTDLIKATNPVKFYEYLSAGKKVVATEIPELMPYKDKYVYMANNNKDFAKYVELCLNGTDTLASPEMCIHFAKENDWQERYVSFSTLAEKAVPQIDIIILTYNNLKLNRLCIDSILKKTAYPNYKIIIVDNLSTDGTREYLKQLADKKIKNVDIILNQTNLGFAGGNNVGIKASTGDYVVLLNNDTIVTRGWLTAMSKHLENNPRLGMCGPVTNSIGNEAKIKVEYNTQKELELFAYSYTTEHLQEEYPSPAVLALFCTMIKREIIQKCGLLDESYGIGMFEDDDYSEAVKSAGYKLAIAEDAFIHHFEGASFKKLESSEFKSLYESNKHKFEEKWKKKWQSHNKRPGITWDTNSQINIL